MMRLTADSLVALVDNLSDRIDDEDVWADILQLHSTTPTRSRPATPKCNRTVVDDEISIGLEN